MKFRKAIFWLHLICGIITASIVLIMSITGVALTYEKQMTSWADQRLYRIDIPADGQKLSPENLFDIFSASRPESIPSSLSISSDPSSPAGIQLGRYETIYVNPYSGEILGPGAQGIRAFFRVMTDWHRWLALAGENRPVGRALTGACNLGFLFLVISGFYLWWPRKWTPRAIRNTTWFRTGLSSKMRDSNWHYVFGFWCTLPLILIVASAVVISYPWASNLVFQLAGSDPPAQSGPPGPKSKPGPPPAAPSAPPAPLDLSGIDRAAEHIRNRTEEWKTIIIQLPAPADEIVAFTVESGLGGQPQLRSTVIVDRNSGEIVRETGFGDMDPGLRARIWLRFVHTGEYYGFWGQTIAGIASVAGVILVWTGVALAYRRYRTWRNRAWIDKRI
jgi:uncharacterized iron-regulated membrane protein